MINQDFFKLEKFLNAIVQLHKSRPTLCDSMDCSLPDSSVHEIIQARILE